MNNFGLTLTIALISILSVQPNYCQQRFKLLAEHKFEGIFSDTNSEIINVLIIHGTGIKKQSYGNKLIDYTFKKIKPKEVTSEFIVSSGLNGISVEKRSAKFELNRVINFYVIHWSDYTASDKKRLRQTEKNRNVNRGVISKFLKKDIMINQFYDFVVFSNPEFKTKITSAMNRTFDDIISQNNSNEKSSINLVSGSLGSSIFLEYVNKLNFDLIDSNKILENQYLKKLRYKIDYIQTAPTKFFMLTNQIHFLEPIISKDNYLLSLKSQDTLQIVAFRHTNDALCFYLPTEVATDIIPYKNIKVVNIRYKNIICGNRFDKAHEKPFSLSKLHDAILFGSKSKRVKIKR